MNCIYYNQQRLVNYTRDALRGIAKQMLPATWHGDNWVAVDMILGFPCGPAAKESVCNAGDLGSILGLGRCPGEGKGYPLWYSILENSMDYIVHGVAKSRTRLNNFHFHSHYPDLSLIKLWLSWLKIRRRHYKNKPKLQFSNLYEYRGKNP